MFHLHLQNIFDIPRSLIAFSDESDDTEIEFNFKYLFCRNKFPYPVIESAIRHSCIRQSITSIMNDEWILELYL